MDTDTGLLLFLIFWTVVGIAFFIIAKIRQGKKAKKSTIESDKTPKSASRKEKKSDKMPKSAPPVVFYQYEPGNHLRLCRCCMCENPAGAIRCEVCREMLS